jgi:cytochrome b subunit of formate dehydrogenase
MKHISYWGSALVFTPVVMITGAALWWLWNALPFSYMVFGTVLMVMSLAFIGFTFVSKGHAMWKIDAEGDPKVLPGRRKAK